jgi:hypothetical protein
MERMQQSHRGRSLTRAAVAGGFLGLLAFVYLPWWMAAVAAVTGALIGVAVPSVARHTTLADDRTATHR